MSSRQNKNTKQNKGGGQSRAGRQGGSGGRQRGGRGGSPKVDPAEFWKPVPQLGAPEPISVTTDPTMVVRSLGDLPLYGYGQQVSHEINRVLVRAAMLAGGLADVAGLRPADDEADHD
jgi:hypothetical protein